MLHMMLLLTQGQLSIFGNAIKWKLKRVASSLKKRPNLSPNLNRFRHRTCIISWIKLINLLVRSLSGSRETTTMVVLFLHRNGYYYWIGQNNTK